MWEVIAWDNVCSLQIWTAKGSGASTLVARGLSLLWYKSGMTTKTFKDVMENVREIGARRTGIYKLSNDERIAVGKGLAQADRESSCLTSWWRKPTNATDHEGSNQHHK
jgi:hypothetical protein